MRFTMKLLCYIFLLLVVIETIFSLPLEAKQQKSQIVKYEDDKKLAHLLANILQYALIAVTSNNERPGQTKIAIELNNADMYSERILMEWFKQIGTMGLADNALSYAGVVKNLLSKVKNPTELHQSIKVNNADTFPEWIMTEVLEQTDIKSLADFAVSYAGLVTNLLPKLKSNVAYM